MTRTISTLLVLASAALIATDAQAQCNETNDGKIDAVEMHKKHLRLQLHWSCDQGDRVSKKEFSSVSTCGRWK